MFLDYRFVVSGGVLINVSAGVDVLYLWNIVVNSVKNKVTELSDMNFALDKYLSLGNTPCFPAKGRVDRNPSFEQNKTKSK
jgi:hypothetical protein